MIMILDSLLDNLLVRILIITITLGMFVGAPYFLEFRFKQIREKMAKEWGHEPVEVPTLLDSPLW